MASAAGSSTAVTRPRLDIADPDSYPPEALDFEMAWIGGEIPGLERMNFATYSTFPMWYLPPVVEGDDSEFPFMAVLDQVDETWVNRVQTAAENMRNDFEIELPEFFVRFMSSEAAMQTIQSPTACYFDLGTKGVVLNNKGVALMFYSDQQGCCFWYLYFPLSDKSRHCVICSIVDIHLCAEEEEFDEEAFNGEVLEGTQVVSPSFDDFIRRTYLESEFLPNIALDGLLTL